MDYKSALQSRGMQLSVAGNCHISCRKVDSLTASSCIIATVKERIHFSFLSRSHNMKRQTSCLYTVPQKHFCAIRSSYSLSSWMSKVRVGAAQTLPGSFSFTPCTSHVACRVLVGVTCGYNHFLQATWKAGLSGKIVTPWVPRKEGWGWQEGLFEGRAL